MLRFVIIIFFLCLFISDSAKNEKNQKWINSGLFQKKQKWIYTYFVDYSHVVNNIVRTFSLIQITIYLKQYCFFNNWRIIGDHQWKYIFVSVERQGNECPFDWIPLCWKHDQKFLWWHNTYGRPTPRYVEASGRVRAWKSRLMVVRG